jgi:hypothetical protein
MKRLLAAAFLLCSVVFVQAQTTAPLNDPTAGPYTGFPFKNTSLLKPPAGAKVAVWEFEDMECPKCAHDSSYVRAAVAHYKLPYLRHDYPLTEIHIWSLDAAVTARYIQNSISPALAERFRLDLFANQAHIESKDDLVRFTRKWFDAHRQAFPFVLDASGDCRAQVRADRALGEKLGIHGTPCLFVVTQKRWVLVTDVALLNHTIDSALAETTAPAIMPRQSARPRPRT